MTTAPRLRAGRAVLAAVALLALALFTGAGTAGAQSAVCTPAGADDFYNTAQDTTLEVGDPANGVLGNDTTCFVGDAQLVTDVGHGMLNLNADGTFSYAPDAGFSGSDSFVYEYVVEIPARQGVQEQVYTATANIFVSCADSIADDEYSVPQDTALVVPDPGVTTNDHICPGRGVEVVNPPTHGTLNSFATDGAFTYTPSAGFVGTDTYTYRVRFLDDRRPTAVQILATVTINVTPVVIVTQPPTTTSTTTTTTTTTVPETTTTIEETTTTEAPTTTTTTAPVAVSGGSTALPRTGSDPGPAVTVGLILVTLGAITLVVRRRRLA